MKAPVIKAFKDKENNKKRYTAKSVYEAKESRIKELQSKGYLGDVIEEKEPEKAETKPKKKKKESE